jgi:hypothetical protein
LLPVALSIATMLRRSDRVRPANAWFCRIQRVACPDPGPARHERVPASVIATRLPTPTRQARGEPAGHVIASTPFVERVVTLFAASVYSARAQASFEAAMEASLVRGSE